MLNKKREKSKKNQKEDKNIGKVKNQSKEENKSNNNINNNKIIELQKSQNYTLDGYGKIKLIEGNLDILGYSLSDNEIVDFNFNEDYPLFKYLNSNNSSSKFEIFQESKYNIYTDIKDLINASNIPKSLISLDINKYSKYLICGKKCAGKNMLIPYIINRMLSNNKQKKIYYLECDIIHPLIPLNYAISLIEIKKPLITNTPILFTDNISYYNIIKSFYIRNSFDIKNIQVILDILINELYMKISNNKTLLLINQFSAWDNNDDVLNNYLYKTYFKSDDKSCVLYIKNKYRNLDNVSNDKEKNNKSILEDIIFKNKNDFYLFGNLFENDNKETKCHKIEVETKFNYEDDDTNTNCCLDINNKKKNEEKISILSHFEINKCKKYSLSLKSIIIFFDNPFINELKNNYNTIEDKKNLEKILIESLINKYCVILKNDLNKNKQDKEDNNDIVENYYLDDISYNKRVLISFAKITSFDKEENIIYFYSHINVDEEIKKNQKIILLLEQRIEKVFKKTKKDTFFNTLSKATFSYDISKENETMYCTNGLNYLGKYEEE